MTVVIVQRSCRAPRVRMTIAAMDLWDERGTAYLLITSLQGIDNAMTPELEERIMLTMRATLMPQGGVVGRTD